MKEYYWMTLTTYEAQVLGLDDTLATVEEIVKALDEQPCWDEITVDILYKLADRLDLDVSECDGGDEAMEMIYAALAE